MSKAPVRIHEDTANGWFRIGDVDPALMRPPVNVLRLSIHPAGLARRIVNFTEWRNHLVHRLQRQVDA